MKTRNGFVSNSSTSSFLIYGIRVNESDLKPFFPDEGEPLECIEEMLKGTTLEWHYSPYDNETCYVGRSWGSVKDDETGKQFKASVEETLKKLFKKDIKCETYEEAWHD